MLSKGGVKHNMKKNRATNTRSKTFFISKLLVKRKEVIRYITDMSNMDVRFMCSQFPENSCSIEDLNQARSMLTMCTLLYVKVWRSGVQVYAHT